jgi:aquaporin Z
LAKEGAKVVVNYRSNPQGAKETLSAIKATFITFKAPISGMSINPARSLSSAIPAQVWHGFWLYFIAPPMGMLLAAKLYLRMGKKKKRSQLCCKLRPNSSTPCLSPVCCQMCKL